MHFIGYESRFDEGMEVTSARLAPYRTHTSRALSVCIQQVGELLVQAQDQAHGISTTARFSKSVANQAHPFDCPGIGGSAGGVDVAGRALRAVSSSGTLLTDFDIPNHDGTNGILSSSGESTHKGGSGSGCSSTYSSSSSVGGIKKAVRSTSGSQVIATVDITVRCLWLCSRPGAGLVRYKVPLSLRLDALVSDYCSVQEIGAGHVRACRIDMIQGIRYAFRRRSNIPIHNEVTLAAGPDFGSECSGPGTSNPTPGVCLLDHACTLDELGIMNGDRIDLLYRPSALERSEVDN